MTSRGSLFPSAPPTPVGGARPVTIAPPGAPRTDAPGRSVENARRAQGREIAVNVVVALFRLVKLSTLHSLDNQAMVRQVEETVQLVAEYGLRTEHNVSILFAHGSVFVGGQLLRANRGVYEGALELGEILSKVGAAEIGIRKEAQASDFFTLASVLADALRRPKPPVIERPSPNIRLRALSASALLREDLGADRVDASVQVARAYASAVVIMRRFFDEMRRGRYELPQRVKRVAQRLVDLSMGETPAFLGVTAARNQNHDEAGRAVNTAILALAMTRQVTDDPVQLSRLAMAALLYDCARARLAGVAGEAGPAILPQLSEQQEGEAAAATAAVLTALGRINEPTVMRSVIAYEAHWERRRARLGPVYRGLRAPSLQARIVRFARAFNDLLTPAPGQTPPSADEAIAQLEQEADSPADRTVVRFLVGALGLFTTGTVVRLSTGETGLVVQTPSHPALYSLPRVRLVLDGNGGWIQSPIEIDLAHQGKRTGQPPLHIKEVVATSDDPAGAQLRAYAAGAGGATGVASSSGVRTPASYQKTPSSPLQAPPPRTPPPPPRTPPPPPPAAPSLAPSAPARAPTAEGSLQRTPFVHLLIYMLDQGLTGTTVFTLPGGVSHAIYFHQGAPAKIRTGTMLVPLDRVLVDEGLADEATLRGTLVEVMKKGILHGRLLVMKGVIDREKVLHALRVQVQRKVTQLFEMPPDTRYAYYEEENLLASYGGPELTPAEPLATIMAGVRLMAGHPLVDQTLAKIAGRPLALHIDADLKRFQLTREEAAVADTIRTRRMPLAELVQAGVSQERVARLVVYALAVTRHLDLGVAGKAPVGARRPIAIAIAPPQPQPAPAPAPPATPPPAPVAQTPAAPLAQPISRPPSALAGPPSSRSRPPPAPPARPIAVSYTPPAEEAAPASSQPGGRAAPPTPPPRSAPPTPPPPAATAPAATTAPVPLPGERPETAWRRVEIERRAQSIDGEDFYQMLGVTPESTPDQVKSAYFALAKTWHPDRLPGELAGVKPLVARVFARLSEAYQTLFDPVKAKGYAQLLKSGQSAADDQEKLARVVDAAVEFQKAEILLKKNDLAGAEQLALKAAEADPDQPEYLTLLTWVRALRRGDPPAVREGQVSTHYDDLIPILDDVLAKEARFERALYYRGVLLKRSGRTEKAMVDFRLVAEVNPKNLDAVREVRLYEMRKRGPAGAAPKAGEQEGQGGLFGKLFKR